MRSKKRHIPEAVKAHRERKARLNASMAQRQSAGLGKAARERLKPLLDAAPVEEEIPTLALGKLASTDFARRIADTWLSGLQSSWVFRPQGGFALEIAPPPSLISPEKLEALKSAEAYKPRLRVPDMVEVITGWRGWMLSANGRLEALGQPHIWPVKQAMVAECANRGGHIAPAFHCTCGIWAFKDLDRLVAAISNRYQAVKVIGSVSLWGRVIETENGYRAQYAYPSELWLLDESLEELGLIYDVPVRR